ncbi:carboxylate-amine ligase [Promicromonospora umidemergens]|uniref:carboxylate-amine ligase n=1 Tax=Promicromonospora umidemergens TaxID=629679 RepID=UPI0020A4BC12|nr:glutamate--cysteine ligase [Promicromonospora umidemergens]MCP2286722.1 carboxylate-amine ligase [Promicromonospora umidemergens]
MRTFGVEEELLVVDADTWRPLASGEGVVEQAASTGPHRLTVEMQQEQVEVIGPPCATLPEQLATIHQGRLLADEAARAVGGRAVALATPVWPGSPSLVPDERYRRIRQHVGLLADEQLTCGFHVHVQIEDREEGVAVLDRIRVWLPVLLALSANSPSWYGVDSGFASYRYQAWSRWPTVGPCEIFGSLQAYEQQSNALLRSGAPLDDAMLYFDARLSATFPTVEVRVADVCMDPVHAAVLAALVRALVETAARQWGEGKPPRPVSVAELRAWTWQASRFGVDGLLVSPTRGNPVPSGLVVAELLHLLQPVLDEYGEFDLVRTVTAAIVEHGSGARHQRQAYARSEDPADVVDIALSIGTPRLPQEVRARTGTDPAGAHEQAQAG